MHVVCRLTRSGNDIILMYPRLCTAIIARITLNTLYHAIMFPRKGPHILAAYAYRQCGYWVPWATVPVRRAYSRQTVCLALDGAGFWTSLSGVSRLRLGQGIHFLERNIQAITRAPSVTRAHSEFPVLCKPGLDSRGIHKDLTDLLIRHFAHTCEPLQRCRSFSGASSFGLGPVTDSSSALLSFRCTRALPLCGAHSSRRLPRCVDVPTLEVVWSPCSPRPCV